MVFGRDELFGAPDPPALLTCTRTRVFTAGRTAIRKAQVIIAPRNAICVDQLATRSFERGLHRGNGLRAKGDINNNFNPHIN